ncbi:MAG: response regulator transcription factor [Bacteroidales bacterium]|nr:response regulator transcription factor [Bacteroidales bacterium]
MNKIKVFIVDDHKIVRNGLFAMLIANKEIEVIGEAGNGEELFKSLNNNIPDVILLDISMPGISGVEISKILSDKYPQIQILIISMNTDERTILSALKVGIKGFLPKDTSKEELIKAIISVNIGNEYFGTEISQIIYKNYIESINPGSKQNKLEITEREIEVIRYISDGLSYKEIGTKMFISPRTVETHRNNILSKLKLRTNIDLVKYAVKNEIINL